MSVFANSMEISSKSMGGKSICEFPDVCFTPPLTPATPPGVPIPYPNSGMAGDTSEGSTSVKIGGEEVMLKDKSAFKQSTGDEAGSAPKKGIVSSKIKGKVYFIAWSMDVKIEGENVVRNLDMTTHNHGSAATGAVPTVHAAKVMTEKFDNCGEDAAAIEEACKGGKNPCPGALNMTTDEQKVHANPRRRLPRDARVDKHAALIKPKSSIPSKAGLPTSRSEAAGAVATAEAEAPANECVQKMRCFLRPYKGEERDGQKGCCKGQTAHHIPPQADVNGTKGYDHDKALCVCLEGTNQSAGSHGKNHAAIDFLVDEKLSDPTRTPKGGPLTLKEHIEVSSAAVAQQCGCKKECIQEQLEKSENFKKADMTKTSEHKGRTSLTPSATEQSELRATLNAKPATNSAK